MLERSPEKPLLFSVAFEGGMGWGKLNVIYGEKIPSLNRSKNWVHIKLASLKNVSYIK